MLRAAKRTYVVSIECDEESGSTVQWVNGISGEYVDREQALNNRPCYLRDDGARLYWDDGSENSRGWWVHDKEFAVYAYHDSEDQNVPEDGWQCPGMVYMYVSIDLKVCVKVTARSRSIVKMEHSCTQGLCNFFGLMRNRCCGRGAALAVKSRGVVVSPSSPADAAAGPRTSTNDSSTPQTPSRASKGLACGVEEAKSLHAEHWPTVRQKASDGFGKAKQSGQRASAGVQSFVSDPENQEKARRTAAAGQACCTSCIACTLDLIIDICQPRDDGEAEAGEPDVPQASPSKGTDEAVVAVKAGSGFDEPVAKAGSDESFQGGDERGITTAPDPKGAQKLAFTEKDRASIGAGCPLGVGLACRKGSDRTVSNSDAAFLTHAPGDFMMLLVAEGRGPQGPDVAEFVKNALPPFARKFREPDSAAAAVLRQAFSDAAEATANRPDADELSSVACTLLVLDVRTRQLSLAHSGDCSACVAQWSPPDSPDGEDQAAPEAEMLTGSVEAGGGTALCPGLSADAIVLQRAVGPSDQALIIGSPGLWSHVTPAKAAAIVRRFDPSQNAQRAAEELSTEAWNKWTAQGSPRTPDLTALVAFIAA